MEWKLALWGEARLLGPSNRILALERKTALLLAWLTVQGPTSRARLAALLWPDTIEARARANLRQALSRLHRMSGVPLVEPGEVARLVDGLEVDVHPLLRRAEKVPFMGGAIPDGGDFLVGVEGAVDGELEDWLHSTRDRLHGLRSQIVEDAAESLENAGDLRSALRRAEQILSLDPLSEEAHRRAMRLHYLLGDRAAALRAWERCKEVLWTRLAVEPLPETVALARTIEGAGIEAPRPSQRLPLAVLRPPRLIGREQAWAQLEEAWNARQMIFLVGPAGVGKTRLAQDFVRSKGDCLYIESLPGDLNVPYASQIRAVRRLLAERPGLELPDWVRAEISRLLPEWSQDGRPLRLDDESRLRFFESQVELLRLALPDEGIMLIDNLHFCDPESAAIGDYMMPLLAGGGRTIRCVFCTRLGSNPEIETSIQRHVSAGVAARIDVPPLDPSQVSEFVDGLGVPEVRIHTNHLASYTGGNPLFLLETIKHLIETSAGTRFPGRLPLQGRIGVILRERLGTLSPLARRLAEVAAIARDSFDLHVAATVLGYGSSELAHAWRELEETQVMKGPRFTHDLHHEAILEGIPAGVEELLREKIAAASVPQAARHTASGI